MSSDPAVLPPPRRNSALKTTIIAAVVVVLAFVAGFVAGAAVDRVMLHRWGMGMPPRFASEAMVNRLDRRLDLTDAQRTRIESILDRHHQRIGAMWSKVRPVMRAEIETTNEEIARVLTPAQRQKFERLRMRLGPRHGPGPGAPPAHRGSH